MDFLVVGGRERETEAGEEGEVAVVGWAVGEEGGEGREEERRAAREEGEIERAKEAVEGETERGEEAEEKETEVPFEEETVGEAEADNPPE